MDDEEKTIMGCLAMISIAALVPLTVAWNGFVISIFWGWFIVPLGLPQISIPHCIGISVIATMLTAPAQREKTESSSILNSLRPLGDALAKSLVLLLEAWIVHKFM